MLILPGSAEESLLATWMESHVGFRMTTILVNEHRREQGEERVSVSAVMSAFYRLQPKVNVLQKLQSGRLNKGWKDASYNIAKQMLVILGQLNEDDVMTDEQGKVLSMHNTGKQQYSMLLPCDYTNIKQYDDNNQLLEHSHRLTHPPTL